MQHLTFPHDPQEKQHQLTLIIKPVHPIDTRTLMVPPQNEKVLRVLDLVRQQQTNRLERLLAPIDIVPQKEVIRLGRETAVFE